MERKQIIKALECCINHEGDNCHICPYHYTLNGFNHNCKEDMCEDALALIKELTDSEDYWKRQTFDACMDKGRMDDKIKELTEENEKLNERLDREARCQYDLCGQIVNLRDDVKYIKAETAQKMQGRFKERLDITTCGYSTEEVVSDVFDTIDRIAEEILEENNV